MDLLHLYDSLLRVSPHSARLVRVAWLLYRLVNHNDHTAFVLNRVCALLFFSAFSIIVVFWCGPLSPSATHPP